MSDPISFDSASPRFGLPYLFAGQAQKEAFVNEAHALTDALLHCAIEGEATAPPAAPIEGTNWLVKAPAEGEWTGHEGKLACRQAENWMFISPRDGLKILNRATGQEIRFTGTWRAPLRPELPSGGTIIDSECRAALQAIVAVMETAGIIASVP